MLTRQVSGLTVMTRTRVAISPSTMRQPMKGANRGARRVDAGASDAGTQIYTINGDDIVVPVRAAQVYTINGEDLVSPVRAAQVYTINGDDIVMPVSATQAMPEPQQTAVFAATFAALGLVYTINGHDIVMPVSAAQAMPEPQQTAVFAATFAALCLGSTECTIVGTAQATPGPQQTAVFAAAFAALGLGTAAAVFAATFTALGLGTALSLSALAPFFYSQAPTGGAVCGAIFALSGVLHLLPAGHEAFCSMYPKQGAWGLWYLPGSASFHVNWTAEILGGAALVASKVPAVADAFPSLEPTAAWGMFLLTLAVTPANLYMATHNAPGPGPKGEVIPPAGHAFRFIMQVFLLSIFCPALASMMLSKVTTGRGAVVARAAPTGAKASVEGVKVATGLSSRRSLLSGLMLMTGLSVVEGAKAETMPFLKSAGVRNIFEQEEEELLRLREVKEGEALRLLSQERELFEKEVISNQAGKLCATPFGVDVVGITELIFIIGATVAGITARQRKDEVERLNQQLREINLSLRQQARSGVLPHTSAPDTTASWMSMDEEDMNLDQLECRRHEAKLIFKGHADGGSEAPLVSKGMLKAGHGCTADFHKAF
eukprot:gene5372-5591_t